MKIEQGSSLSEVLRSRIKTPLVWGVLFITVGLTLLFYYSQNEESIVYTRYVETLSDYKFLQMRLMRSLEQVRFRGTDDVTAFSSQLMSLRETAIAVETAAEDASARGDWMPADAEFRIFERNVQSWVAASRRYASARSEWVAQSRELSLDLLALDASRTRVLSVQLDSARLGYVVASPDVAGLPDTLADKAAALFAGNAELSSEWSRIDNDAALVSCETLIQSFKMKNLDDLAARTRVQQVFYLLSIALLLFTVFFASRKRSSTKRKSPAEPENSERK
jgi:hypothetical protein